MKIAIIGAGLAGLATAYYLLESERCQITLFDEKGVGGGASGVCSGLLHPYPGLGARRSFKAEQALTVTKNLIRVAEGETAEIVARHSGIYRMAVNDDQLVRLLEHSNKWGDVESIYEKHFLIHSGITVNIRAYLRGLMSACEKKGAELVIQKVKGVKELESFDHVVIAAGFGVKGFVNEPKIKFLKGQALVMEGKPPFEKSFISKGYIAHLGGKESFEVGSTYEREFSDDKPNLEVAKAILEEKLQRYCSDAKIVECRAGVRVSSRENYLPVVKQVAKNAHLFTALGSRGLLYHGLFAKKLAHEILLE